MKTRCRMNPVDWRTADLAIGVLREPAPDASRIVLWLPGNIEHGFQHWERITNVPGAEIAQEQGLCFTQATAMPARQKMRGFVGSFLSKLRQPGEGAWLLPTGGYAELAGERQTGLLLVWPEEETGTLDEAGLQARWGGEGRLRRGAE